jgi:hypothetical protein
MIVADHGTAELSNQVDAISISGTFPARTDALQSATAWGAGQANVIAIRALPGRCVAILGFHALGNVHLPSLELEGAASKRAITIGLLGLVFVNQTGAGNDQAQCIGQFLEPSPKIWCMKHHLLLKPEHGAEPPPGMQCALRRMKARKP